MSRNSGPPCASGSPRHFSRTNCMNDTIEAIAALKHVRELHFMGLSIEVEDWQRLETAIRGLQQSQAQPPAPSEVAPFAPNSAATDTGRDRFEAEVRRHFDPARADDLLRRDDDGSYGEWALMLAWEVWQSANTSAASAERLLTAATLASSGRLKASALLEAFNSCGRTEITLNRPLVADDLAQLLAHLLGEPVWYATHGDTSVLPPAGLPMNVVGGSSSAAQAKYWAEDCGLRVVPLYARSPR